MYTKNCKEINNDVNKSKASLLTDEEIEQLILILTVDN